MLTADGEAGAEVYSAATTRDQARIVFDDAKKMATMEAGFRQRFGVRVLAHSIFEVINDSRFLPLSAEGSTLDGLNIHFACVDELHAHKTRAVYDVLETGTGARAQSMIWNITTAGSDRSGICYEQRGYVVGILNDVLRRHDGLGYAVKGATAEDDTYFGIIYTIDDDDDWADEACWAKANPNYGISIYPDDIRRLADKAIKVASARANFLTKRLNVWVNAATAWMDMRRWDDCGDTSLSLDQFAGDKCWISLDLASKIDIAAKMRLFEREINGVSHYFAFGTHYLPEEAAQEEANSQYAGWVEDGWLTTTPGNVTDYDVIEEDIRDDLVRFDVQEVPYDPWQATQLASHMLAEGAPMVELRQTVQNMSEAMKNFEALVLSGRFHHNGDPVLTWMVSNVVAHRDAKDNIYPRKEREENKIDGAVATIMAISRACGAMDTSPVIGADYELMII
jgi:phage terminase large subunit-like protein